MGLSDNEYHGSRIKCGMTGSVSNMIRAEENRKFRIKCGMTSIVVMNTICF